MLGIQTKIKELELTVGFFVNLYQKEKESADDVHSERETWSSFEETELSSSFLSLLIPLRLHAYWWVSHQSGHVL